MKHLACRSVASIKRIMSGNKLAYNHLIRSLMHAFIVSDGEHVEEVKLDEFPPEGSQYCIYLVSI